ncbi:MAG TPA: hypothetical protein VFY87_31325 [Geminicoccaceae bacterium]|nr:hypothetical protein [Geminicoccaceae bacterium]
MFPYRRNGPKKRGKGGGGGRRHHDHHGGGRRVPGSAAELLPMLQPTTKALAQMLAGNTKTSGQLIHARNVLGQANRMVEDRLTDRLPPAAREEFLEQLARLKLTIADADEAGLAVEPDTNVPPRPAVATVGIDRLREVALRLATAEPAPQVPAPVGRPDPEDQEEPVDAAVQQQAGYAPARLRAATADDGAARDADEPRGTGPRRERLRLKPVQRVASESDS